MRVKTFRWAGRFGYGAVGLVLGPSAVLVVLAGAWRAGALPLPRPSPPSWDIAGRRWLSARERADRERSARLLNAIPVAAGAAGGPGGLSEFERILLHGVAEVPGREYPPAGHGYPRP
ncbi:hypothetical protein ACFV9E_30465 [Streptomyces sp. NPDC059835]|uniref:hypothetical protein n=1 Tax=Streptomyces sp. NPDC059835 TaxID=3346967 RepID=UPI00365744A2